MKFLLSIALIMAVSFLAGLYAPWWTIALVAFLVAMLVPQHHFLNFLAGFTGIFLLWGFIASYISNKNDDILAHKVSMIILKTDSPILLIITTALVGGIVAGLAAYCGSLLRAISKNEKSVVADL